MQIETWGDGGRIGGCQDGGGKSELCRMYTEIVQILKRVMQGTAGSVNVKLCELCMHVCHLSHNCKGGEKVGVMC